MFLLILSISALFAGLLLYPLIKKYPASLSFFDAFALIAIVGLTMMHLIPHSVENAGFLGVLAVAAGLAIPILLHKQQNHPHNQAIEEHDRLEKHNDNLEAPKKRTPQKRNRTQNAMLVLIFVGFIIHTLLDGIGLSVSDIHKDAQNMLGLGVLFHRLPIGVFLSLMLVPQIGLKRTWGIVGALAATTAVGYALGHFALPSAGLTALYIVQGLIAGSLLHVVVHNVSNDSKSACKGPSGLGALAGIATLVIIEVATPGHGHDSVLDTWTTLLIRIAPIWCLGALLLAGAYPLSKTKNPLQKYAKTLCKWIDPQPTPAAFSSTFHLFPWVGIALLPALFSPENALLWFIPAAMALFSARVSLKKIQCCHACAPESLCPLEKSFPLWLAASWMQLAGITLIASVLPLALAPIQNALQKLPPAAATAALCACCTLGIARAWHTRGLSALGAITAAFSLCCIFSDPLHTGIALGFATLLIFLYDYHPADIAASIEHEHPWKKRYALTCTIVLCLAAVPAYTLHAFQTHRAFFGETGVLLHDNPQRVPQAQEPLELVLEKQHPSHHEHDEHDALAHNLELEHDPLAHNLEHGSLAHNLEHEHGPLAHNLEHEHGPLAHNLEHEHDPLAHNHEHNEHNHEHGAHAHTPSPMHSLLHDPMHDPIHALAFLAFLITGLFFMLRSGPRHLLEDVLGKHHHQHG